MADYFVNFKTNSGQFTIDRDKDTVKISYHDYDMEYCALIFTPKQFTAIVEAWQKLKDQNAMTVIKVEVKV